MSNMTFADLPEDRQSDAKDVAAAIRRYLTAVKACDELALRATFEPSANISHHYVKGDAVLCEG
jgi:hypothetical protein